MNLTEAQIQARKSLGTKLKSAREALALSSDDLAQAMKVSNGIVSAIESGQYDRLGPRVYACGFLRSYAKRVNFSLTSDIFAELGFAEETELLGNAGIRQAPDTSERWMLSASYVVGTAILVSAAVLVMQADRLVPNRTPVPTVENATTVTMPVQASPQNQPSSTPTVVTPAPSQPAVQAIAAAMTPIPPLPTSGNVVPTPDMATASIANGQNGFSIKAVQTSWIRVVDGNGKELFGDNLSAGEMRDFVNDLPMDITIGNAQGAELLVAGKTLDVSAFVRGNVAKFRVVLNNQQIELQAR